MPLALAAPPPPRRARLSRRRKLAFIALTFAAIVILMLSAVTGLDVYVHRKVQYEAGVNIWGYRGDPVGKKKPGELRIVVLGGSTAFGYGLRYNESWPYYLEQALAAAHRPHPPVTVVNLGIPTDSARTFVSTLEDYQYLDADIALFYEGYNDLGLDTNPPKNTTNPAVSHYLAWRHQSPIFRWTGYFPILPLVLNEKASILLHGRAGAEGEVAFRPDIATRTTAAAIRSAADIGVALERRLGQLTEVGVRRSEKLEMGCGYQWGVYCGAIEDAVVHVVQQHRKAIVITQPYFSDLHVNQQAALATMMAQRFGSDPHVRYVNLGRLINMRDREIAYDGLHLVARGNKKIADQLMPVVLDLISS